MTQKHIYLDLYTGDTRLMEEDEVKQFQVDIQEGDYWEEVQGDVLVYKGEEAMVIVIGMS